MMIFKYVLLGIVLATAVLIAIYDAKYQKIPMWLLLTNYGCLACLTNLWLLLGLVVIILAKYKNFPIDILFLGMMSYLIIIVNNNALALTLILAFLVFIMAYTKLFNTPRKIPAMLPLEFCISVLSVLYVVPDTWKITADFVLPYG
jgi:hypothetical protein